MITRKNIGYLLQVSALIYMTLIIIISHFFTTSIFTSTNISKTLIPGLFAHLVGLFVMPIKK